MFRASELPLALMPSKGKKKNRGQPSGLQPEEEPNSKSAGSSRDHNRSPSSLACGHCGSPCEDHNDMRHSPEDRVALAWAGFVIKRQALEEDMMFYARAKNFSIVYQLRDLAAAEDECKIIAMGRREYVRRHL